jgi:fucose permease
MFALTASFWAYTGACHRARVAKAGEGQPKAIMRKVLTTLPEARSAWLSALFVLVYVGVEYVLINWFTICFQPTTAHKISRSIGIC